MRLQLEEAEHLLLKTAQYCVTGNKEIRLRLKGGESLPHFLVGQFSLLRQIQHLLDL